MDGWEEILKKIHSCLLDVIASNDVDDVTKRKLKHCAKNCFKLMEAMRKCKDTPVARTKLVWLLWCFIANVCSVISVVKK